MKFKALFIVLFFFAIGCSKPRTSEEQAHYLVKTALDLNLNDPSSYQSVAFSSLDSLYTSYFYEPEYRKLQETFSHYIDIRPVTQANYNTATRAYKLQKKFRKTYKPRFIGWQIVHRYRAKNRMGVLVLEDVKAYLNKDLTKVDSTREID